MRTDTVSRSAMSRLLRPAATRLAISRSRTVSGSGLPASVQRGGAKPSAGGGKTVRGASCFAGGSAVAGGLIGGGGLRGGVRGQQQRTDLFELLRRGIYCVGIAVGHRGGVRGQRGRQSSAGSVGDLNEACQT